MSSRAHLSAADGAEDLDAAGSVPERTAPESAARDGASARHSGIAARLSDEEAGATTPEALSAVEPSSTADARVAADPSASVAEHPPGAVDLSESVQGAQTDAPALPTLEPADVPSDTSAPKLADGDAASPAQNEGGPGRAPAESDAAELTKGSEPSPVTQEGPAPELRSAVEPEAGPAPSEPDPTEMTAAELAFELAGGGPGGSSGTAPRDAGVSPPERAGAPRHSPSGRGFHAPWVDEVPEPITPYELRNSETVRIADLPPADQLRGRVLANRYLAEETLEQRASGISYRAYHLALDRSVLVRVLPRGLACSDDLCREVRRRAALASGLGHPNIGATLDFGVLSDGWPYLVTEHLAGQSLAALLGREGKFVLRRVLHIGKQLAAALSAAHDVGLIHGFIHPDNVFVVDPGSPAEVALLLGFGVSSARGQTPGPPRSGVFGVPFYVSPEQASCKPLDVRSDLYSLGVVLYELMTGAPPFSDGDFAGVLCQHLDNEPPPPSSRLRSAGALAKAMDAVVQRCLHKEPSRRYASAADLRDDLTRLEEAAARTKRRPMPEIQRPTTTIHSPPPKAEGNAAPEAKVIVHDDADELEALPRGSDPGAAREPLGKASVTPVSAAAVAPRPGTPTPAAPVKRPPRVSVDQATIKISAVDRARFVQQRPAALARTAAPPAPSSKGWVSGVLVALRRFFASASGGDDSGK